MKFGSKPTRGDKMAMVEKRLGATTKGTASAAKPSTKVRPTGNPMKGKIGVKVTRKF